MLGGLDDKPAEIRANGGDDPVLFPYSDYGVDQVGYCISTRRDLVESNPDLVDRFVDATIEAYTQTEADPDTAVAAIADIVGGTMAEEQGMMQARSVLDVTLGILYSSANTERQLGLNVPSDWESMVSLMQEYNDLDPEAEATSFYTNQFID
jgi:NitT/TauT family transport system substrate-binding protein